MGGSGVAGNYTMYVNPFMVVNNMKFTKHYYMGSQRVVSKLGEMGAHQDMLNPREMKRAGGDTIEWDNKEMKQKEQLIANFLALGLDGMLFTAGKSGKIPYGRIKKYFRDGGTLPGGGNDDQNKPGKPETLQFFYHPDHLGSSSFITDVSGEVYQHVQYFPFGETFVEERTGTRYTPYLYNGKELDEETGLYYYHARYYDPRVSMFYGVDPLAEKYIGISSYAYVGNNPLIFVDPDGREIDLSGMSNEEKSAFMMQVQIHSENNKLFAKMYSLLEKSETVIPIVFDDIEHSGQFNTSSFTITYKNSENNQIGFGALAEELFHAYQHLNLNGYAEGEFNLEFEAKVAVTAMLGPSGIIGGMGEYQNAVFFLAADLDEGKINLQQAFRSETARNYIPAANVYSQFNRENQIGNNHYKTNTTVYPFSLINLLIKTYE